MTDIIAKRKISVYVFSLLTLILCASCASAPRMPERRPLTEKERNVKIETGDQATTLRLHEKCKTSGGIRTFSDEYAMKVSAASANANVAQIIYSFNDESFTVKFWSCP